MSRKERIALFIVASHHQGGHSHSGMVISEALGIKFPVTMKNLATAARKDGLDPKKLWPWLDKAPAIPLAEGNSP